MPARRTELHRTTGHKACDLFVTISLTASVEGGEFLCAYAASKFAVEGWMESLAPEVAPFGIGTMLVEPGFVRTELLTPESTKYAEVLSPPPPPFLCCHSVVGVI